MHALIAAQQIRRGDVAPAAHGLSDQRSERFDTPHPEVEAMRRDRMHAYGSIADQREALADEATRVNTDQRIRVARRGEPHVAEALVETPTHVDVEGVLGHDHEL